MNKDRLEKIRSELSNYLEIAHSDLSYEGFNQSEKIIFLSVITLGWAITQVINELEKDG